MNGSDNIPNIRRITFFNGQRLTAEDLTALQNANRDLRWLHNRSLHGWGIGTGFAVTGERGDTAVQIGPGYAIDCLGREIILTDSVIKSVPNISGDGTEVIYFLTAAYQDDSGQQVLESRPGVCMPGGTVRLSEAPALNWRTSAMLPPAGNEIILAQVWILNCQLNKPVSLAARRFARISSQPYIAAGQTVPGQTKWALWQPDSTKSPIGVIVTVDTSAARFHSTPAYIAHIAGDRIWTLSGSDVQTVAKPIVSLVDATAQQFTVQASLSPQLNPDVDPTQWAVITTQTLNWHVVWMGTEG